MTACAERSRSARAEAFEQGEVSRIRGYADARSVPSPALIKMAKLGIVISHWMQENDLVATAIQCWNSIQKNYGVNACTLMAMIEVSRIADIKVILVWGLNFLGIFLL